MTDDVADNMARAIVQLLRPRATREERRAQMTALFGHLKQHADPHHQHPEWRRVFAATLGAEEECNGQ